MIKLQKHKDLTLSGITQAPDIADSEQIYQHGAECWFRCKLWTVEYVDTDTISHNNGITDLVAVGNNESWWIFSFGFLVDAFCLQQTKQTKYCGLQ